MIARRLQELRGLLKRENLSAYIITGTDPHQSEYVCDRWKGRQWISGFSGSAGTVVVTESEAGLWTDSRYYLQADQELASTEFTVFKQGLPDVPEVSDYVAKTLEPGCRVGIAANEVTMTLFREMRDKLQPRGIILEAVSDLLQEIWTGRPGLPEQKVYEIPLSLTGFERGEKIKLLRQAAGIQGADSLLITTLDDIAWVLNLRGNDIPYNPVFLSYLCITSDQVVLYCSKKVLADEVLREKLSPEVTLAHYNKTTEHLPGVLQVAKRLHICPDKLTMELKNTLPDHIIPVEGENISGSMKAVKNSTELKGIQRAHSEDGAALTEFLCYLEQTQGNRETPLTEYSLGEKLLEFRKKAPHCIGESFAPIAGFKDHGAIVHYSAKVETSYALEGNGLLILDSGGQYEGGTTDVTRTLLFGEPAQEHIRDYTLVLKAHLSLARQKFPAGTCGYQLDGASRLVLWNSGMNYGHGTGHGVGHMLNVHEGPQNISPKPITTALRAGMVLSNEPGVYRSGKHGIRIENLLVVVEGEEHEFGAFYQFENLTLCPYENRLIDISLLKREEINQINTYHLHVYQQLYPRLSKEAAEWLKAKTHPLA